MNSPATLLIIAILGAISFSGCSSKFSLSSIFDSKDHGSLSSAQYSTPSPTLSETSPSKSGLNSSLDNPNLSENFSNDKFPATSDSPTLSRGLELTYKELRLFNGEYGKYGYISVDKKIYNVTKAKGWINGKHVSHKYRAGMDYTKELLGTQEGALILNKLPIIGKIILRK